MKRDDSVFFFTLVDFLLTALFFGVVLFAVAAKKSADERVRAKELLDAFEGLVKYTGISNITELTDSLTRLGPAGEVQRSVESVRDFGGVEQIKKANALIQQLGGLDSLAAIVARRQNEGYGMPPCLFTVTANGRKVSSHVATVVATDTLISFVRETAALDSVLRILGRPYSSIATLGLADFKRAFLPLLKHRSDCRYSIQFIERTRYVDARDAVGAAFRLSIVRP